MRTHTYGQRDYAIGQAMVTLRTAIGLTQMALAQCLGLSRHAVQGREASVIPKPKVSSASLRSVSSVRPLLLGARKRRSVRCGKRRTRRW
jgi:transcriptional regulator with XRE-family HTH domain